MTGLGILAAALLVFGLFSRRLQGTFLTVPMVFVAAGLVAGGAGLIEITGLLEEPGSETFELQNEFVLILAEVVAGLGVVRSATGSSSIHEYPDVPRF